MASSAMIATRVLLEILVILSSSFADYQETAFRKVQNPVNIRFLPYEEHRRGFGRLQLILDQLDNDKQK
jgi:hypothetical protein